MEASMPEPIANSPNQLPDEPELRRQEREPKGVLRKNLKPLLYLGAALLVIVAAIFSGTGRKTTAQKGANSHQPPQPMLQVSQPPAFPASPAHNRANTRSSSFPRQPRRSSSWLPKTVNSPMRPASRRT